MAQTQDDLEQRNVATIRTAFDAWANGTGSPYDLLAEDVTWEIVNTSVVGRTHTGKEHFLASVVRPFSARLSAPLMPSIRNVYVDGDTVIVVFDVEGTASDGLPYRNVHSWFLRLHADQIVANRAFFDSIAFDDVWQRVTPATA